MRFTALLHHVTVDRLREAYRAISPNAAPGIDGVTWRDYGLDLEANLRDLHARVHRGAYRASPTRRVFIPKPDGRLRPLGVAALEDKIVQRAVVEVLNAIYEEDFLGFSYGFRPGRRPHDALDALAVAIERKKVNWVLDADIRDFFTQLDQGWLERFLEHRIADKRILRLIQKWLRAGVIEDGEWSETEAGTAQGASVSPLLSNVFLHYVFDLWADQWRRRRARGDVVLVRFADDFLAGFQHREDAERFLADLRERFAGFGSGTASGQDAADRVRTVRRRTTPGAWRSGSLRRSSSWASRISARRTGTDGSSSSGSRARRRCAPSSKRSRPRCDDGCIYPIPEQGRWLARVLQGHYDYYAVPDNIEAMRAFRDGSSGTGATALSRRSQKGWTTWEQDPPSRRPMATPTPHPSPLARTSASTPEPEGGAQCVDAHAGIRAGGGRQRPSLPRSWSAIIDRGSLTAWSCRSGRCSA